MIIGSRNWGKITPEQIEQIKKRCHTELYKDLGESIGLDFRRVGELVSLLGISRKRTRWGRYRKPFEALYNILVTESHRGHRDIPVLLSYEEFVKFTCEKTCHYCGSKLIWLERVNHDVSKHVGTNLDRKDNTKGYSVENCVACCGECNLTKGDRYTYEEFMLLAPALKKIQRLRKKAV